MQVQCRGELVNEVGALDSTKIMTINMGCSQSYKMYKYCSSLYDAHNSTVGIVEHE